MAAGYNIRCHVVRMQARPDDEIGGAVLSGTYVYKDVQARFEQQTPEHLLLQQGIEGLKTYKFLVRPANLLVYERDEIEISWPMTHPQYGERFRIGGVERTSLHPDDSRGYLLLHLTKSERAHGT